jgi:hypothetical protein
MPKVVLKRSSVSSNAPTAEDLDYGELAINYADGKLYYKTSNNTIGYFISGANSPNTDFENYQYTATQGQTTFTGTDDNSNELSYTVGQLTVFLNGIKLTESDYAAENGTSIVLTSAASLNDIVEIVSYKNLNLTNANIVTVDGTQTLTNKTIDASNNTLSNIGNSSLTNSSVTINNNSVSLGGTLTLDTDDVSEGVTNLYYTDARATAAISVTDSGGDGSLSYNSSTGVITYTGPSSSEVRAHLSAGTGLTFTTGEFAIDNTVATLTGEQTLTNKTIDAASNTLSNIANSSLTNSSVTINSNSLSLGGILTLDTDDIGEGVTNLYYTDARAQGAFTAGDNITIVNGVISGSAAYGDSDARAAISVTDSGGDGSLSYNSSTGVITYTGPSASEVRAHFTGGAGVTISNGEISIGQAVATNSDVTFNDVTVSGNLTVSGTTTTINTETINLADNTIVLNSNEAGTPSQNSGIEIERGTSTNAALLWDETNDYWVAGISGSEVPLVTTSGTQTLTNKTIDASSNTLSNIANSSLTNSSVTINSNSLSLGGTLTLDTDDIGEGSTNLYYTDARSRSAISVTDSGGDGSLSYNSSTGVLTYTGPSASEVRSHFTAGSGISILAGQISVESGFVENYTDADARAAISVSGTGLSYNSTTGVITLSGYNNSNWDTAYGWGNHASAGYLTSFDITTQTDPKYLRSNANDTATGVVTFSGGVVASGGISGLTINNGISGSNFNITGVNELQINDPGEGIVWTGGASGNITLYLIDDASDNIMNFSGAAQLQRNGSKVWDAGNDGSGSGLDADLLDGRHLSGNTGIGQILFNNQGRNHSTTTNFNDTSLRSGVNYIQGGTNAPTGSGQWYSIRLGLGDDYDTIFGGSGDYFSEITWSRQGISGGDTYLYVRDQENGSIGSWRKFSSGYADSAGNADTVDGVHASGFVSTTNNSSLNSDSRNTRGVTRLYRRDNNSDYSVQTYWTGTYWRLYGYNGDTGHADTHVGYSDNSGALSGYGWTSSGKNVRATEFYADNWFRNYNAGEGLYNEATGCHFVSDASDEWTIRDSGNTIRIEFQTNGTTLRGSVYADNNPSIGFLNNNNEWGLRYITTNGQSPNLYFLESGNESWTGNPGSDQGKIEYHSNRFYIAAGSNSTEVCRFRRSGTDVVTVSNSGDITASGNVTAYSDERLKENVKQIENAIDIVEKLRGVTFDWKATGENSYGVIAQEVQAVLPELVVETSKNSIEGEEIENILSVDYGKLTSVLIEAIKEQQKLIEEQESRINSLEKLL